MNAIKASANKIKILVYFGGGRNDGGFGMKNGH